MRSIAFEIRARPERLIAPEVWTPGDPRRNGIAQVARSRDRHASGRLERFRFAVDRLGSIPLARSNVLGARGSRRRWNASVAVGRAESRRDAAEFFEIRPDGEGVVPSFVDVQASLR